MIEQDSREYYLSRKLDILELFDTHMGACRPFMTACYDGKFAEAVIDKAREQLEALIPEIPYIGGDANPMTRHLIRSTTSLALYKVMKRRGIKAEEVGKIIFDAVEASVSQLARLNFELTEETIAHEKEQARISQARRFLGDWVWEFVEGEGEDFDYGYDFLECGAQKLYRAQDAEEYLPFYCYLDFITQRTAGWGFARSMTLAEGHTKCDFRWKKGGETEKGWPPPFSR